MSDAKPIVKYGATWPAGSKDIEIEMWCIGYGGRWKQSDGTWAGAGLYHHYREFDKLLWPKAKWHRWDDLLLQSFCENRIVGIMGPASSGKTNRMARWALMNYFIFSDEITILVSSTDLRGLELRIWGEIKKWWRAAKKRYPSLAGNILEARMMITTEGIEDEEARDFRNGIIAIPCMVNNTFVGLGKYVGIKNDRVMLLGDELQFMQVSFLESIANLNSNAGFSCIGSGNPKDPTDALGKMCEPAAIDGGWDGLPPEEKTKTWRTRFLNGLCVNLVGTDSPNMDVSEEEPVPFPFLITREKIKGVVEFFGKDSLQYWMQCVGMMRAGLVARRVITRMMCLKFRAMEQPVWKGEGITKVLGLDAAYGNIGGDRCALSELHFGYNPEDLQIISYVGRPVIVPVTMMRHKMPEDQIVDFVSAYANERGIPPQNVFFDSTGRGTLASAFARIWSPSVVAVEFGGKASDRIVAENIRIKCCDYYCTMVTELWYSVRYAIEAGQFRGMPEEVMEEGCMREWKMVSGNRIQIEPKDETKIKLGRSPDLFDSLVVAVEGARRLGFRINKLGSDANRRDAAKWLKEMQDKHARLRKNHQLSRAA